MDSEAEENEFQRLVASWEDEMSTTGFDPRSKVQQMCDYMELGIEHFMKMDPDPFDTRHPSRIFDCLYGTFLKICFKKEHNISQLFNDYTRDNYFGSRSDPRNYELNTLTCRFLLDILPGIELSHLFQDILQDADAIIIRMFNYALNSPDPLRTYATGLMGAAMEISDLASDFREANAKLIPVMLKRLQDLQQEQPKDAINAAGQSTQRPFAHLGQTSPTSTPNNNGIGQKNMFSPPRSSGRNNAGAANIEDIKTTSDALAPGPGGVAQQKINGTETSGTCTTKVNHHNMSAPAKSEILVPLSPAQSAEVVSPARSPTPHSLHLDGGTRTFNSNVNNTDCSNSSWAEMETFVIGSFRMYPLTWSTKLIYILRYLAPMGQYQEILSHVYELNVMELLFKYINLNETKDARLAFEALKFLGSLLAHKKFSFDFLNNQGLQRLLDIRRPSVAACGVAMCLFTLSCCEDTMEKICSFPYHVIRQLIRYALWLLECSHDSSRCHIAMFFNNSLAFPVILDEFDKQDGLRKVCNVICTQSLIRGTAGKPLSDDEKCASRQIIHNCCVCFKRYFETHLFMRYELIQRTCARDQLMGPCNQSHSQQTHHYAKQGASSLLKPVRLTNEQVQEYIETLMLHMSVRAQWTAVDNFISLGGIGMLLLVITRSYDWNFAGRPDTVRCACDTLAICTVITNAQLQLCQSVDLPSEAAESIDIGLLVILDAARGELYQDPVMQRAALSVIVNCVCGPIHRLGSLGSRFSIASPRKNNLMQKSEEVINTMWDSIRTSNGIMVLLQLMQVKTPITEADSIRMLACKALAGLSRSETVSQIISRLPIITDGQLQLLMRDPILQDREKEHVQFQKYAVELLENVLGKKGCSDDASLSHIHKSSVVAQSTISYDDKQLLQVIHNHLVGKGYTQTAQQLVQEAKLQIPSSSGHSSLMPVASSSYSHPSPKSYARSLSSSILAPPTSSSVRAPIENPMPPFGSPKMPSRPKVPSFPHPASQESSYPVTSIKIQHRNRTSESSLNRYDPSQAQSGPSGSSQTTERNEPSTVTLDGIVTQYLRNQHSLCKNPVATCAPFDLFKHHKCPDPRYNRHHINFALRLPQRQIRPPNGGPEGAKLDRRLVHSRFCPIKTFRPARNDSFYTCVQFHPIEQTMLFGTYIGSLNIHSLQTGEELHSLSLHESYINNLEVSRDGRCVLASSPWGSPLSSLFLLPPDSHLKISLTEEDYVEFSKVSQNMIIGTRGDQAHIYDVETGKKMQSLMPKMSNYYTKNRATFSPDDELVLSDGVLWDVHSNKAIHKFDKLNQVLSGVFHPGGLEVISNTEVWDLRTFHLLRTVPSLDQCSIQFASQGDVLYCGSIETDNDENLTYGSSFKTIDGRDYSSIATIDLRRKIHDLALNKHSNQLAVVENLGNIQEYCVRIYDIGRRRIDEDEGEDDDDDDDMDESASSSDSSSDSSGSGSDDDDDADDDDDDDDNDNIGVNRADMRNIRDLIGALGQQPSPQRQENGNADGANSSDEGDSSNLSSLTSGERDDADLDWDTYSSDIDYPGFPSPPH